MVYLIGPGLEGKLIRFPHHATRVTYIHASTRGGESGCHGGGGDAEGASGRVTS